MRIPVGNAAVCRTTARPSAFQGPMGRSRFDFSLIDNRYPYRKFLSTTRLSVLPPEKLRERMRHRRVRLSREVTLAPFAIPATLARRKRDPGATLLHPFLSLEVTQSQSVAVVSQK